jgi:hypothetical protein
MLSVQRAEDPFLEGTRDEGRGTKVSRARTSPLGGRGSTESFFAVSSSTVSFLGFFTSKPLASMKCPTAERHSFLAFSEAWHRPASGVLFGVLFHLNPYSHESI